MNHINMDRWVDTLGWVLLHSLWQGLFICLLLIVLRRIFHTAAPSVKYAISTLALSLQVIATIVTIYWLYPETGSFGPESSATISSIPLKGNGIEPVTGLPSIAEWINPWLPFAVDAWLIGIVLFGFRLIATWLYTIRLRMSASPVTRSWQEQLISLSEGLGLQRTILLAESSAVNSPVLLGYLKPIILLPVGMVSGLSGEQVEAILLHELAHIRRHDFAVNFIQSLIEVVFFFNPFVWMISSQIRTDRELCCDDVVVQIKSPLVYAQALRQLAEVQTFGTSLSLGMAGNKNLLLTRIKRIMKTSERNVESRGKVIPALLVMMVLALASWLSIQAYSPDRKPLKDGLTVAADTLKKDQEKKSTTYSRKSITTYDDQGIPHKWVERVPAVMAVPPVEMELLVLPDAFEPVELAELAKLGEIPFPDTLGEPRVWIPGLDGEKWEKEFTEKFRERFSDFYEKNRPEFEKMMTDMEKSMSQVRGLTDQSFEMAFQNGRLEELQQEAERMSQRSRISAESVQEQADHFRRMAEDMRVRHREVDGRAWENQGPFQEELNEQLHKDGYVPKNEKLSSIHWEDNGSITVNGIKIKANDEEKYRKLRDKFSNEMTMRQQAEQVKKIEEDLHRQQERMNFEIREQEAGVRSMERNIRVFESELTEQLIKDGYLNKGEKINSINWEDNGAIKINGKKIKESDESKYREMHRRFLREGSRVGVPE